MAKRIYHSGKSVTVNWLNASQYLGPSNPGVVFVANPTEDWQYPLLKANSFDLANLGQYFVTTTNSQTIDGEKTFNTIPKIPTATLSSGLQAVNIDRLNTSIANANALLAADIVSANNAISALSSSVAANYVALSGTQTIPGLKTFQNIRVPTTPSSGNEPVSLTHFDNNAVNLANNQTIGGVKTFNSSPKGPNPTGPLDLVNNQTLQSALAALVATSVSPGVFRLGQIQVVFGSTVINSSWATGVTANTGGSSYNSYAPTAAPFVSIAGGAACIDRLVTLRSTFDNNGVAFSANKPADSDPQLANGQISWVVIGYTS